MKIFIKECKKITAFNGTAIPRRFSKTNFMNILNSDTNFVNTFSEQDNHNIPKKIIEQVKNYIASPVIAIKNNDGSIITLPARKRGNAFYNLDIAAKMAVINRQAVKLLKADIQNLKTNTFFITLTTKYDPLNPEKTTLQALARVNSRLPKFLRYMRKNYKCSYIWAKESHRDGGCHVHLIIQCKNLYQCFRYIDADGVETFRSDELRADIRTVWAIGNVDIQGVMHDSGVFAYVSKELGKSQNVEKALKRIENGEPLKKNDTNKIWMMWAVKTLAKLHEFKTGNKTVIRVIGYSKVYRVTAEEQQAEKERILAGNASINNNTNSTQEQKNNDSNWSTEYTL